MMKKKKNQAFWIHFLIFYRQEAYQILFNKFRFRFGGGKITKALYFDKSYFCEIFWLKVGISVKQNNRKQTAMKIVQHKFFDIQFWSIILVNAIVIFNRLVDL